MVLLAGAPRAPAAGHGRLALTPTATPADVARRLADVRARIGAAGREPDAVSIVAVTKGQPAAAVEAALAAGLSDIGENYAAELVGKHAEVGDASTAARWHFLGHVQRNKVARLAPLVGVWQGVDRIAAGSEIAARAPGAAVLVQVNLSGDPARNGCPIDDAPALVDHLVGLGLDVRGLMGVGPAGPPERARDGFRALVGLADELGLPERSIGMSDDLEVAVEEGSTTVRVGRALFGPRPPAGSGSSGHGAGNRWSRR